MMKKSLLFAVLLSFTINATVQAQLRKEPYDLWDLLIGGKAGASASTLTKTGGDYKFWPTASIYTEVFVNQHFSMSVEVAYNRKGVDNVVIDESTVSEDLRYDYLLGANYPYTYNLDYITTSYLLKYYFNQHFGLYTGLGFSTLVSAKSKVPNQEGNQVSSNMSSHLYGGDFNVPVGVEIVLGQNFTIDGRWNWSPRKIAKSDLGKGLLGQARHQYFSLTLGYKFLVF